VTLTLPVICISLTHGMFLNFTYLLNYFPHLTCITLTSKRVNLWVTLEQTLYHTTSETTSNVLFVVVRICLFFSDF